jgi:hypothetical protein
MWAEIVELVRAANCRITVYVDDITISGEFVPEQVVWTVKQVLRKYGHSHSRRKERRRFRKAAEVTGVIVGQGQLCAPHRHFKKLQDARLKAKLASEPETRDRETARARSLEAQLQTLKRRKSVAQSPTGT